MFNIEKKSRWVLSGLILLVALGYVFTGFGLSKWVLWTNVGVGVIFGLFIFTETAVFDYFRKKGYKTIAMSDVFVWIGLVLGTLVIVNSLAFIGFIRDVLPEAVLNFLSINGLIVGGFAGLYAIALLWFGRPE